MASSLDRHVQRPAGVARFRRGAEHRYGVSRGHIERQAHGRAQRPEQRAVRHHQHQRRPNGRAVHRCRRACGQLGEAFRAFRGKTPASQALNQSLCGRPSSTPKRTSRNPSSTATGRPSSAPIISAVTRARDSDEATMRGDATVAQQAGRRTSLRDPGLVQRNIDVALRQPARVPIGLAVTEIPERDRRKAGGNARGTHRLSRARARLGPAASIEQRTHGAFVGDAPHRLGQQRGDGELADVVRAAAPPRWPGC